jgi:Holliday junction resolvase-like predicted endonuclease
MEDPGEQLVGEYLREIKECDFIEYNLQTKFIQGEIDVIGINTSKRIVYFCEVATHLETGLQYTKDKQPNNVDNLTKKFEKDINYAEKYFSGFEKIFMLWTPIIVIPKKEDTKHNQLRDINEIVKNIKERCNVNLEVIFNEKYFDCIKKLRVVAGKTSSAMNSPIMRFLQIEEKLKSFEEKK